MGQRADCREGRAVLRTDSSISYQLQTRDLSSAHLQRACLIGYPQVTSFSWLSELRNQTFLGTVLKNSTFRRLPGLAVGTQLIFGDILYLNHLMISPRDPGQLCFLQSTRTHTNLTHTDLEGKKLSHEGHKAKQQFLALRMKLAPLQKAS